MSICSQCQRDVPDYDGVHLSSEESGDLGYYCGRCYADFLAEKWGGSVEHLEVHPVVLVDTQGERHAFHFRYNPVPRGLKAFEVRDGEPAGYRFGLLADEDESAASLVGRLLSRVRRGLAHRHLAAGGTRLEGHVVRGYFECDPDDVSGPPQAAIDGQPVPWEQLGAMLSSSEGWEFRLEIVDPTEEV